ncbi:enoyl-CoA hydratase [Nocardioides sp. CF8]|nr:enoyl-CoA hydratase [Nocardioides sp. CF8]
MGDVTRSILESETPVVAAVQGGAWGAGLALACACDLVVAGQSARFVASFGRYGLIGDTGIFFTLQRRVTTARAREILLLNADLSAEQAAQEGIATVVVPDSEVWDEAIRLARRLAEAAPHANAWTKRLIGRRDGDFESVLAAEIDGQLELLGSPAFAEGQRAFLEKRAPHWWDDDQVAGGRL